MDLVAYSQIEDFEYILKENNIYVPRLRGIRCMADETPSTVEDYREAYEMVREWELEHYRSGIEHGRKVKLRRHFIHSQIEKRRRMVVKNLNAFNRFVGQQNVFYIHARIGGKNWLNYGGSEIAKQPWFICKVDDYFDSTYCDIYVKVKERNYGT